MRKFFFTFGGILVVASLLVVGLDKLFEISTVRAATISDTAAVGVTVDSTISISTPPDVDLGTITGTGASSEGTATWTVTTNNSAGYKLEWQASTAGMMSGADAIAAYGPAVVNTPETWSVPAANSEWGARLKSASTDNAAEWGTDDTSERWLNVSNTGVRQIVSRSSETAVGGSTETIEFQAEIGSSHFQPTGNYSVNVTVTATTL